MNKILIILSLVLLASCAPNEFPSKDLVERQGLTYEVNSQTPYSGPFESYLKNGQLKSKANYKDGENNGLYERYHDNGQLHYKTNYKDGKLNGDWKYYNEDGTIRD